MSWIKRRRTPLKKVIYKKSAGGKVPLFPVGDSNTLGVWLDGYVNGARGKTLIDPLPQDAPSGAFQCGGQLSSSHIV